VALRRLLGFCHFLLAAAQRRMTAINGARACFRRRLNSDGEISPILTGCQTRDLPKSSGEIGLAGKVERERNIDQGLVASNQQRLGAFEPLPAHVTMGRLTDGGLEGSGEMETAQTRDRCQMINGKIALQVSLYVIKHAGKSASIKSFP
jgi:hypothetical protein